MRRRLDDSRPSSATSVADASYAAAAWEVRLAGPLGASGCVKEAADGSSADTAPGQRFARWGPDLQAYRHENHILALES